MLPDFRTRLNKWVLFIMNRKYIRFSQIHLFNPIPHASFREHHLSTCEADLPNNDDNFVWVSAPPPSCRGRGEGYVGPICGEGGCVRPIWPTQYSCWRIVVKAVKKLYCFASPASHSSYWIKLIISIGNTVIPPAPRKAPAVQEQLYELQKRSILLQEQLHHCLTATPAARNLDHLREKF